MPSNETVKDWVLWRRVQSGKVFIDALNFADIKRVEASAKVVSQKDKRVYVYTFRDGSTYVPPDDAVLMAAPLEHRDLLALIARHLVL